MCDDVLFPLGQESGILLGIVVKEESLGKVVAEEREGELAVKGHEDKLQGDLFEVVPVDFLLEQFADVVQILVKF